MRSRGLAGALSLLLGLILSCSAAPARADINFGGGTIDFPVVGNVFVSGITTVTIAPGASISGTLFVSGINTIIVTGGTVGAISLDGINTLIITGGTVGPITIVNGINDIIISGGTVLGPITVMEGINDVIVIGCTVIATPVTGGVQVTGTLPDSIPNTMANFKVVFIAGINDLILEQHCCSFVNALELLRQAQVSGAFSTSRANLIRQVLLRAEGSDGLTRCALLRNCLTCLVLGAGETSRPGALMFSQLLTEQVECLIARFCAEDEID